MLAAAFAVAGSLLAGCGGTSVPSVAPTASPTGPSITTAPIVQLPTLPTGWVRYEAPGAFTVGVPGTWLVMTPAERDDPTAAAALKTAHPDFVKAIDTAVAQMRQQGTYLHAYDVAGDTSAFTTNMNVLRVSGPLTATFAKAAAATVQAQFELADPLDVQAVAKPAGAYRYQFAEDLRDASLAGMQYLIPAGTDVYVMTFLTTVAQTDDYGPTAVGMAETFAAIDGGSASTSPAPTSTAAAPDPGSASAIVVQAESASLQGAGQYTLTSETSNIADTHGGYLYLGDGGAKAVYTVAIPADATYYVWIRIADDGLHPDGARSVSVDVGGSAKDWVNRSRDTKGWTYEAFGSLPITSGSLRVTFTKLETTTAAFSMDEFVFSPDPDFDPSAAVAPGATAGPVAGFDPVTGVLLDASVPDACVLLPGTAVGAATGYPTTTADPTYFKNGCRYIDRNLSRVDAATAVNRYVDVEHARAAARLRATTPSDSGRPWVSLPGYDDLFYATGNGEVVAVSGVWLVMVNAYQVGPDGAGTLTDVAKILVTKLAAAVDRL
jgi:hypothetical protein